MKDPERPFDAPWHAQAFALAVHLSEAGHFAWPDFSQALGATLQRHGRDKALDGGDDYYLAWLETLETLLAKAGKADPRQVEELREAWKEAYLTTPHGAPVSLPEPG